MRRYLNARFHVVCVPVGDSITGGNVHWNKKNWKYIEDLT